MSRSGDAKVGPVAQSPAYDLAAEQMRRAILMGRYLPGEKFPPERELSLQLNVSRATLREAVRTLVADGLVKTTRGAQGGVIVTSPPSDDDGKLRKSLRENATEIDQAMDLRNAIESHSARLAAERRTKKALARIERAFDEAESIVAADNDNSHVALYVRTDNEFHQAIATATGNPLMANAVEDARARMFFNLGSVFSTYSVHVNDFHAEIVRAIADQEPDRAAQAMRTHIETSRQDTRDFARRSTRS